METPSEKTTANKYGGGSLLIAWQLKDRRVLIVGGGEVASQRIESILTADAFITVLSPAKGLNSRAKELIALHPNRITYYDRRFTGPAELHKVDMVLTAIDDVWRSREIVELCRQNKVPVNAADIPDCCDFYFGSQIRDGPLQIMISTNGNGPRIASLIKNRLQASLNGYEGEAIRKIGSLREKLKARAPGVGGAVGRKRMKWMSQLCNEWEMENFAGLDDTMMNRILEEGWERGRVPSAEEIMGKGVKRKRGIESPPTTTPRDSLLVGTLLPAAGGFIAGAICMALTITLRRR